MSAGQQRERECEDFADHDFAEEYYGHKCKKCGLFFAFGHAPWDEEADEREIANG